MDSSSVNLPFFASHVPAGFPSPADDYIDKTLDVSDLLVAHPASTFFVRVKGDSMQGAGISCGDILVVDRSLEPMSGRIIIAILDGEFTVKRLILENGKAWLVPENPTYSPLEIPKESDFQVWGTVTFIIKKCIS